jgi:hypothetical protein
MSSISSIQQTDHANDYDLPPASLPVGYWHTVRADLLIWHTHVERMLVMTDLQRWTDMLDRASIPWRLVPTLGAEKYQAVIVGSMAVLFDAAGDLVATAQQGIEA